MIKKLLLIPFFASICLFAKAQLLSSWYISSVTIGGVTSTKKINPAQSAQDAGNIDFVNGAVYNFQGYVNLSEGADQAYNVYFKFVNNVGTENNVKIGALNKGDDHVNYNLTWTGSTYGTASGTTLSVFVYFQAAGQTATGQSNIFINFTPRSRLVVPASNVNAVCKSTQLNANASGGAAPLIYSWAPSTGLSSPTIANPVFSGASTTSYVCIVKDSGYPQQIASNFIGVAVSKPVITGSNIFYGPCNGGTSTYSYNISTVPPGTTNIVWSLSTGSPPISSYIYTGSLPTGINLASLGVRNGFQFTISCTYTTPSCGSQVIIYVVTTQLPYCMPPPVCSTCPVPAVMLASSTSVMTVYPNPTTDRTFNINFPVNTAAEVTIAVTDNSGNIILQNDLGWFEVGVYTKSITLTKSGTYIIKVINGGDTQTQRVSLQ